MCIVNTIMNQVSQKTTISMAVEEVPRITIVLILLTSAKVISRNSEVVWFKTMIFNVKIVLTEVTGTETKVLQVTKDLKNTIMMM